MGVSTPSLGYSSSDAESVASVDYSGSSSAQHSPSRSGNGFNSLGLPMTYALADDTSVDTGQPSICVDYLSHDWREEDVWHSWRNIKRHKNEIANGVRLENASWRTWWKQRNHLPTISAETLNWLKDSDVTWLYGPLRSSVDPVPAAKVPTAQERLNLDQHNHKKTMKTILKHRTLSQKLLLPIVQTTSGLSDTHHILGAHLEMGAHPDSEDQRRAEDAAAAALEAQQRPPLSHSASEPVVPMETHSTAQSNDDDLAGKTATRPWINKRQISFNTFVEQRIALNEPERITEPTERRRSHPDSLKPKSPTLETIEGSPASQILELSPATSTRSVNETVTIHKIPPTTLKTANLHFDDSFPVLVSAEQTIRSQYTPRPEDDTSSNPSQSATPSEAGFYPDPEVAFDLDVGSLSESIENKLDLRPNRSYVPGSQGSFIGTSTSRDALPNSYLFATHLIGGPRDYYGSADPSALPSPGLFEIAEDGLGPEISPSKYDSNSGSAPRSILKNRSLRDGEGPGDIDTHVTAPILDHGIGPFGMQSHAQKGHTANVDNEQLIRRLVDAQDGKLRGRSTQRSSNALLDRLGHGGSSSSRGSSISRSPSLTRRGPIKVRSRSTSRDRRTHELGSTIEPSSLKHSTHL